MLPEEPPMDPTDRQRFLRALRSDETFREEVRRELLTERLLELPDTVAALVDAVNAQHQQLAEHGRQIAELTQAVRNNSRQIAELTAPSTNTAARSPSSPPPSTSSVRTSPSSAGRSPRSSTRLPTTGATSPPSSTPPPRTSGRSPSFARRSQASRR